jgi:hypothetical protein
VRWAAALFLVVAFMALISRLGVPGRASAVVERSRRALADVRSNSLTELDKERAVQAHARSLFASFLVITALSAIALLLPVGVVWLLAAAGLLDFDAVLAATLSWPILLAATAIGIAMIVLLRRRRQ